VAAVQRRIAERHYFESRPGASCLDAETFLCRATSSLLESSLVTTRSGPGDRPRDLTVIMKQYREFTGDDPLRTWRPTPRPHRHHEAVRGQLGRHSGPGGPTVS
jgi:hypothetical protein